ncbi:cytochrome P450 monooxygenase [Fusarium pseudocircinatum]|uniref:Cytochrome P450 monooxygenase n=1 Tax=Fusarium pseudocircinatum TaxID=56676 RepID=A0A8H5LE78_9HYPO|nr:cytochrome P450 monooxygenase [Fusarium pseudocircinatum]
MISITWSDMTVACAVFLVGWLASLVHMALCPRLRDIPGPWMAKISQFRRLGLVWNGNAHQDYRDIHKRYGPIVRTAPNVVDVSDPAAISTIYGIGSKFLKSPFYQTLSFFYEDEIMESMFTTTDPEEHKSLKRPVAQKFSMTSLRTLEYLVDPCSEIFSRSMLDLQGQVVDLGAWCQWYAFDVIGAITFSKRFGFMEHRKDINNVISGIEAGLKYAGIVGQIPSLHRFLLGNRTFRKIIAKLGAKDPIPIVTAMVTDSIREYDSQPSAMERADFLAYFRQKQKSTGEHISHRDLINHLMNNLLAGSDTTAISLRAVFYYIIKNRRVYQKLRKEIDEADQSGKLSPIVTFSESLELDYLQSCIKEALRMHPGVSYPLERVVPREGIHICGKYLPAGTIVGMNAVVIHRNKSIFGDDADTFRPERWLDNDVGRIKIMDRHNMTFGVGARTCIGKNVSIMEMAKFIPQVLRQFDLEWASSEEEWKIKTYWFAKQTGLLVRFYPRKKEVL